jgi:transcriptional regulator with XRE-family HTH domain
LTKKFESKALDSRSQKILENINLFIETEGLKRKRLAKKMGMSESNFSDYLNGKRTNILDFAGKLAEILGFEQTFFMNSNFKPQVPYDDDRVLVFSAGNLSEEGKEGLNQLLRICELIETYNMEERSNA